MSNLPPGCSIRDIEESAGIYNYCDICNNTITDCICPACPVCDAIGDADCYTDKCGGLKN